MVHTDANVQDVIGSRSLEDSHHPSAKNAAQSSLSKRGVSTEGLSKKRGRGDWTKALSKKGGLHGLSVKKNGGSTGEAL